MMQPRRDPLYWRLVYADDTYANEPVDNLSIRLARPGAVELHVIANQSQPLGQGVARIPLIVDGNYWTPIFYRRRFMSVGDIVEYGLEATVFGRVIEAGDMNSASLWAAIDGKIVDCPEHLIDVPMLEAQLAR